MVSSIHTSTQVSLYNSQAPRPKGHHPRTLRMPIIVFSELEHVWIIEVPDNQGSIVIAS